MTKLQRVRYDEYSGTIQVAGVDAFGWNPVGEPVAPLELAGGASLTQLRDALKRAGRRSGDRDRAPDAGIAPPPHLFFGTTIATCVIVLKKSKADNRTLFIDASSEFVRQGNKNKLTEANREKILNAFVARVDAGHFAALVDNDSIAENGYNIAVSAYVDAEESRETIDVKELNAEIARTVARQSKLRHEIDAIVAELEGGAP